MKLAMKLHVILATLGITAAALAQTNPPPPPPTITAGQAKLNQDASTSFYPATDAGLLIKNGNFSQPDLANLGRVWDAYPGDQIGIIKWHTFPGIEGWTAISGGKKDSAGNVIVPGYVEIQKIVANRNQSLPNPGGQYCELDAHWHIDDPSKTSDHGIQQTVSLPRGHYMLIFDYRARHMKAPRIADDFTVKVKPEGGSEVTLVTENNAKLKWERATVGFDVSGGDPDRKEIKVTLKFDIGVADPADSFGAFIDNVILLPGEMMVDGNRDGEMSFTDATIHGKDGTTAQKPYRFWLNNDHDEERTVDGSDREQDDYLGSPDFNNERMVCERDLEDWSRLWISFKGIVGLIKSPGVTVELAWKPTDGGTTWPASDGNPGIKVMRHDSSAEAGATTATYLTDKSKGHNQVQTLWSSVIRPVSKGGGYTLTTDFLQFVTEEEPYMYLLFEGWTAGKGQLVLNIKKDGQKIGEYPPVYIELKDVKEMYERYTVGDVQNANTSVLSWLDYHQWPANSATLMPTPSRQPFAPPSDETKDYVLWVHGWNMSPFDKDSFGDTAFKRLFWQGYKGRFGTFRWPTFHFTGGIPPVHHFDASEHRAWASSLGLLNLCNQLNRGPFAGKVRMMAHSMGNVVAGEALRRAQSGQVVHTYVASQAAIPAHCYDATAPLMPRIFAPETPNVYGYYWQNGATSKPHQWQSEGRPCYMHSDYMSGKAGRFFNYYNEADWALNGLHWQIDQKTKPNVNYGYQESGGSFWGNTAGFDPRWLSFPTDRHEIFAWVTTSYSFALGAQWVAGVVTASTGTNRHLKDAPFNYGQTHKYHSGQFRGMNMERHIYWEQLLIDFGLKESQ